MHLDDELLLFQAHDPEALMGRYDHPQGTLLQSGGVDHNLQCAWTVRGKGLAHEATLGHRIRPRLHRTPTLCWKR